MCPAQHHLPFPCRELLRCEAALARLYCRTALLNIFAPKLPHLFTRLFHIPAIRDITLEHLQLLSNQLLAPPLPGKPWPCCCHCPSQQQGRAALTGSRAQAESCSGPSLSTVGEETLAHCAFRPVRMNCHAEPPSAQRCVLLL